MEKVHKRKDGMFLNRGDRAVCAETFPLKKGSLCIKVVLMELISIPFIKNYDFETDSITFLGPRIIGKIGLFCF